MIYTLFLWLHLACAFLTVGMSGASLAVLLAKKEEKYAFFARVIGSLAAIEIVSGLVMSLASPSVTALSLCANIGMYLSAVVILEGALYLRMKKVSLDFPLRFVISPIIASLTLFTGVLTMGF